MIQEISMTELELILTRMGNVDRLLNETCKSEWSRTYWTNVREGLRRRLPLAEMYDQGLFWESDLPDNSGVIPRQVV